MGKQWEELLARHRSWKGTQDGSELLHGMELIYSLSKESDGGFKSELIP